MPTVIYSRPATGEATEPGHRPIEPAEAIEQRVVAHQPTPEAPVPQRTVADADRELEETWAREAAYLAALQEANVPLSPMPADATPPMPAHPEHAAPALPAIDAQAYARAVQEANRGSQVPPQQPELDALAYAQAMQAINGGNTGT